MNRTTLILIVSGLLPAAALADNSKGIAAFEARDFSESIRLLRPAADKGDAEAQYYLGFANRNVGLDNADDPKKAVGFLSESHAWFEKSALQGYAQAQTEYASDFNTGLGAVTDYGKALEWMQKAYANGDEGARLDLQQWYEEGHIVSPSWEKAQELARAAKPVKDIPGVASQSELDKLTAQLKANGKRLRAADPGADARRLAAAEAGDGVQASVIANLALLEKPEDCGAATKWSRRAGESGDPFGYTQFGLLHLQGRCVKQDFSEARRWFSAAAAEGEPWALLRLARMETFGHGQAPDPAAAYLHLSLLRLSSDRFREDMAPMLVFNRRLLPPEKVSEINAAAAAQAPALVEKQRARKK